MTPEYTTNSGMSLREKQSLFASLVPRLIDQAIELGFEVTFGETWRSEAEAKRRGFEESLHRDRLAIDLNLFRGGEYLRDSEDYRPLGDFWKGLHPLCRWGGDFNDGNHFSITHAGRA